MRGNDVELFRSGDKYFPAIFESLATARRYICIEMYAIWDGEVCNRLCEVLANRAIAGISVRVIADAIGSRRWSRSKIAWLRDAGAKVILYNPVTVSRLHRVSSRAHRKLVITDGEVAFVGGFNFADVFASSASSRSWTDHVVRIRGPAVAAAQASFERAWRRSGAPPVAFTPPVPPLPLNACGPSGVLLINSPAPSGRRTVRGMHEAVIGCAESQVSIWNPFFLPDAAMLHVIAGAVRRGVNVRAIVPGETMAHRFLLDANRHRYTALLKAGVKLFEFASSMMHAKTIVADRKLTLVGSANFDPRSISSNDELTVAVADSDFAAAIEAHFEADLSECAEVPPDGVRSSVVGRFRRRASALLARFL